jgi:hypothetical protein
VSERIALAGLLDDQQLWIPDGQSVTRNVNWCCVACGEAIEPDADQCPDPDCMSSAFTVTLTYEGQATEAEVAALLMLFRLLEVDAIRRARQVILNDLEAISRAILRDPEFGFQILMSMKASDPDSVSVVDGELIPTLMLAGPDPCNPGRALTMSFLLPDALYDRIGVLS